MELVVFILFIVNIYFGCSNFEDKNYKIEAFNFFSAGVCFAGIVTYLLK